MRGSFASLPGCLCGGICLLCAILRWLRLINTHCLLRWCIRLCRVGFPAYVRLRPGVCRGEDKGADLLKRGSGILHRPVLREHIVIGLPQRLLRVGIRLDHQECASQQHGAYGKLYDNHPHQIVPSATGFLFFFFAGGPCTLPLIGLQFVHQFHLPAPYVRLFFLIYMHGLREKVML